MARNSASSTHSGFIALVGRPNVGKSTLLNALIGEKISITSPKPQTTRFEVNGIVTTPRTQFVYVDSPGLHHSEQRVMNRYLNRVARDLIHNVDVVVWVVDVTRLTDEDNMVCQMLTDCPVPVLVALNKIDELSDKNEILSVITKLRSWHECLHYIPISALKRDGLKEFHTCIETYLPESPFLYPDEETTSQSKAFRTAELIREALIQETDQELPYATAVSIERLFYKEHILHVSAVIWVERAGQKAIVIGKKGVKLKQIGTRARQQMERVFSEKVFLQLWVKIKESWSDDEKSLKQLGFE